MKAADIMVKDVVTAGPEASVRELATIMLERRISGMPVVDGGGRVLGIVSEGDLIRRPEIETDRVKTGWLHLFLSDEQRARDFVKSHGRKAREVMTQPAICVAPDTPLAEIVRLMERHRIKRLMVVDQGKLAGLVTRADLLRATFPGVVEGVRALSNLGYTLSTASGALSKDLERYLTDMGMRDLFGERLYGPDLRWRGIACDRRVAEAVAALISGERPVMPLLGLLCRLPAAMRAAPAALF